MQPTAIAPRHQAGHHAGAATGRAGSQRLPGEASLKQLAMMGLLAAGLAVTQFAQASAAATEDAGSAAGIFGVTGMHLAERLDDSSLASIRGRYVDARVLDEGGADFVILWDERHGQGTGSDGKGAGRSISTGLGNQQSTTVTTGRGQ